MHATIVFVSALASLSSAAYLDSKACKGTGACVSKSLCNYQFVEEAVTDIAYRCGPTARINVQEEAAFTINFQRGLSVGVEVPKAEFPDGCDLAQPGPNSTLIVSAFNIYPLFFTLSLYSFIDLRFSASFKRGKM